MRKIQMNKDSFRHPTPAEMEAMMRAARRERAQVVHRLLTSLFQQWPAMRTQPQRELPKGVVHCA
jgi:hypothetical protein